MRNVIRLGAAVLFLATSLAIAGTRKTPDWQAIDLQARASETWKLDEGKLRSTPGVDNKPVQLELAELGTWEAYTLELRVRRISSTGGLVLHVPVGDKTAVIDMGGPEDPLRVRTKVQADADEAESEPTDDVESPKVELPDSTRAYLQSLADAKECVVQIRNTGEELRVTDGDGVRLLVWRLRPEELELQRGPAKFESAVADAAWEVSSIQVRKDLTAAEREAARRTEKPKPAKAPAKDRAPAASPAPTVGTVWWGTRTSSRGPDMSVTIKVLQVDAARVVLEVTDGGNAKWNWNFKRTGSKITLDAIDYRGGPNGAGRDITISKESASGTISENKLDVKYSWHFKQRRASGTVNGRLTAGVD
jgi:hypothetical protein